MGDEFEESNYQLESPMAFFDSNDGKTLSVYLTAKTTPQLKDDGTVLKFYIPKEAFVLDDKTGYYFDECEYTVTVHVTEN